MGQFSAVVDRYYDKGLSVMPLHDRSKKPMEGFDWQKYQKNRASEAEIKEWKKQYENDNIAIITGSISGIIVLDIDGPVGEEAIKGKEIPKTVTVKTGKGTHYFYRLPKGIEIRNSAGLHQLKNVDIRGEGGYVVAPGSVHPNGNKYTFLVEHDFDDLPIAECPAWIYEKRKVGRPKKSKDSDEISRIKEGISEGGRNHAAAKLAGHYFGKSYEAEDVMDLVKSWNKRNKPPLSDVEIETTVRSVEKRESDKIGDSPKKNVAPIELDEAKKVISKWLYYKDTNIIDVIAAVIASNSCGSDPIWVILIGGSSSGKTELLRAMDTHEDTVFLDRMTKSTLVTGFKKAKGILEKIGSEPKTFVLQDLSTILSKPPYERMEIIDTLRQIYNGKYFNAWGNGKTFTWNGKISLIGGSTPDIESHSVAIGELGERFMYYRLNTDDQDSRDMMIKKARDMEGHETQAREEIMIAMHGIVNACKGKNISDVVIPDEISNWLMYLVDMTTVMRTPVKRNSYRREIIEYAPAKEGPGRMFKACQVLIKALALVRGRSECNDKDYGIIAKVCCDSLPSIRREVLKEMVKLQPNVGVKAKDVAILTGYQSTENIGYYLADLAALDICDRWTSGNPGSGASMNTPFVYAMKKEAKTALENCGLADIL